MEEKTVEQPEVPVVPDVKTKERKTKKAQAKTFPKANKESTKIKGKKTCSNIAAKRCVKKKLAKPVPTKETINRPESRGRKKQEFNKFVESCKAKLADFDQ